MLGNESSMLLSLVGTKVPKNESFEGTKAPTTELSFLGTKILGYKSSIIPTLNKKNNDAIPRQSGQPFRNRLFPPDGPLTKLIKLKCQNTSHM